MTPERFARLREILLTFPRLPEDARGEYLDRVCEDDAELRQSAESLMANDMTDLPPAARTGGVAAFFGLPVGSDLIRAAVPLPQRIGTFRVLGVLGEGGMGIVYRAEQTSPIRREVAIKRVPPGSDRRSVLARFETERQALALMEHPGIARVYEAGADDQHQPYFVMELVRGIPINHFCREKALSIRHVVSLFRDVCRAIEHAHQKGIIHRDLKPNNILVTEQEGKPVPKVIDFGVAKALDLAPHDGTLTREGQILGTLDYMSPEQAAGRSASLDTRSDVYALGVVLHELVGGTLPYDLGGKSLLEAARIIAESPPRGIRRTGSDGQRFDPDLNTIVLKSLEKEPGRRYGSAAALAEDLDRYLEGQPILAHPPSTVYQLRKLIGRHKAPVALAGTLLALTIAYAVTMSVMFESQRRERRRAELEAGDRQKTSDFLVDIFRSDESAVKPADEITARELMERAMTRVEEDPAPESRAHLMAAVGQAAYNLGLGDSARAMLDRSLRLSKTVFGPRSFEVAEVAERLASAFVANREYERALTLFDLSAELKREHHGPESEKTLKAQIDLADVRRDAGDPVQAEADIFGVIGILERTHRADSELMLESRSALAYVYRAQGRNDEAERLYKVAIDAARRDPKLVRSKLPQLLNNLAFLLRSQDRHSEAVPYYRESLELNTRTLGERHPSTRRVVANLAAVYALMKEFDLAEELLRRNLRVSEETYPQGHWRIGLGCGNLGSLLLEAGRPADAEPMLQKRADIYRSSLGPDHLWTATAEAELAVCCLARGDRTGYHQLAVHCDRLLSSEDPRQDRSVVARLKIVATMCDQYGLHERAAQYRALIDPDTNRAARHSTERAQRSENKAIP